MKLLNEIFNDMLGKGYGIYPTHQHIKAALDWLCLAQDIGEDDGISAIYSLINGWSYSYPETTGYIIPTFYDCAEYLNRQEYSVRAEKAADWLTSIQFDNGSFPGGVYNRKKRMTSSVFNTGQILFGMIRSYQETSKEVYRSAYLKAADWLISVQEDDGYWNLYCYKNGIHAYNARVAWALLEVFKLEKDFKYLRSAESFFSWLLKRQRENGWFENAGFKKKMLPYTHTIAYTLEGLLESGVILKNDLYIERAKLTADVLKELYEKNEYLAGAYDSEWNGTNYSCLTGNAQISIIWSRLYQITGEKSYFQSVYKINNYLKSLQNIETEDRNIHGAVKGSFPIWGRYMIFRYPNWAVKFFIDALLHEEKILNRKYKVV